MTDNGSPYVSHAHWRACQQLGIKHLRTRPYRPRTNGKAERFIQALTRGWAHGPHASLNHKPPGLRLTKAAGNYS